MNTATISYPRRPNYYFDIHEEVDHLYYYHLRYDRRMGINTFQPDDFVLKEVELKPEDSEFKSSIETNDGRVCMLLVLDLKFSFLFPSISVIHFMYFVTSRNNLYRYLINHLIM